MSIAESSLHPLALPTTSLRVLVTGVEQNEGAHVARTLAAAGHHVFTHSFTLDAAEHLAGRVADDDGIAHPVAADLTLESDVDNMFTHLERRYGGIDALVHTAWLPGPETACHSLSEIRPADWGRFTYDHMALLFHTTRRAAVSLHRTGSIGSIVTVTGLDTLRRITDTDRGPARDSMDGAIESFALAAGREPGSNFLRINNIRLVPTPTPETSVTAAAPVRLEAVLPELIDPTSDIGSGGIFTAYTSFPAPVR
ncbi:SDR family oxidoreductase [Rhodococcus pyridinivorans]